MTVSWALSGQRFGRLLVIEEAGRCPNGRRLWRCMCDCGTEKLASTGSLRSDNTRSCGCLLRERQLETVTKHGGSSRVTPHPLYRTWIAMRARCRNKNHDNYPGYGGRGITIDPRWDDFARFARDMGAKPGPGYSIDRVDVDGPYSPENCRWATFKEQRANQRPTIALEERPTLLARIAELEAEVAQLKGRVA